MIIQKITNWLNFHSSLVPSLDSKNFKISRYLSNYFCSLLIIDPDLTRQNKLVKLVINSLQSQNISVSYHTLIRLTQENLKELEESNSGRVVILEPSVPTNEAVLNRDWKVKDYQRVIKFNPFLTMAQYQEVNLYRSYLKVQSLTTHYHVDVSPESLIIFAGNQTPEKKLDSSGQPTSRQINPETERLNKEGRSDESGFNVSPQSELINVLKNFNSNFSQFKYAKLIVYVDSPQDVQDIIHDFQYIFIGNSNDLNYQNLFIEAFNSNQQYFLHKFFNHTKADYLHF